MRLTANPAAVKRQAKQAAPEQPLCPTCYWSDWSKGGRCLRPVVAYMKRSLRRSPDDPTVPSIGIDDFCGDHVTSRQIRERTVGRAVSAGAAQEPVAAPVALPDAPTPAGQPDLGLLAILTARSQRRAS